MYPLTDVQNEFHPTSFHYDFSLQCVYFEDEQADESGLMQAEVVAMGYKYFMIYLTFEQKFLSGRINLQIAEVCYLLSCD